jgi:amino-acid N-acetyltransferase
VVALVREAGLPTDGIEDAFPAGYSIVKAAQKIVGVAGLEQHGDVGLLRSVAIVASERGQGLGRRLVENRLDAAKRQELQAVYLLTTTADRFFRDLGFDETHRDTVPVALRGSSEFASVCPASAVCMVKRLG